MGANLLFTLGTFIFRGGIGAIIYFYAALIIHANFLMGWHGLEAAWQTVTDPMAVSKIEFDYWKEWYFSPKREMGHEQWVPIGVALVLPAFVMQICMSLIFTVVSWVLAILFWPFKALARALGGGKKKAETSKNIAPKTSRNTRPLFELKPEKSSYDDAAPQ